jgi:hypothetical protein
MKLDLILKQSYGRNLYYPVGDSAKLVCKLANCTTLTDTQLKLLRQLGFEIAIGLPNVIQNLIGDK